MYARGNTQSVLQTAADALLGFFNAAHRVREQRVGHLNVHGHNIQIVDTVDDDLIVRFHAQREDDMLDL